MHVRSTHLSLFFSVAVLFLALTPAFAQNSGAIASQYATVNGVKLHYMRAGHGPALILLHGYAETSRMWVPAIPVFATKFTVIAPDLPGIGDSDIPSSGLNMKSAAVLIHGLVESLQIDKARVVGHDIGLMVAYAYAAQFPAETEKLVLMDAFLPASTAGSRTTTIRRSGTSGLTGLRPRRLSPDASASTSNTSGMTLPPTRPAPFPKPIAWPIQRPIRAPAA